MSVRTEKTKKDEEEWEHYGDDLIDRMFEARLMILKNVDNLIK